MLRLSGERLVSLGQSGMLTDEANARGGDEEDEWVWTAHDRVVCEGTGKE